MSSRASSASTARSAGSSAGRRTWIHSQDRHLVAQHDDLDGEIGVTAEDESDELEDAAERPVEEREGRGRMLAAPESSRQRAGRRLRMACSARTGTPP